MSIEVVKAIAALCMIAGGDKNDMTSVVDQIENSQIQCHKHYASCYKKETDWASCMLSRKSRIELLKESFNK